MNCDLGAVNRGLNATKANYISEFTLILDKLLLQEPMTTERADSWDSESGCDEDDEDCLDGDEGSGDGGGGYWDRMTTSGSRTSKSTNQRPVLRSRDLPQPIRDQT